MPIAVIIVIGLFGFVIGLLLGTLTFSIAIYLGFKNRENVQTAFQAVEQVTRPTGAVFEPPSDLEVAREQIIQQNSEQGLDTKLSDLYE